MQIMRLIVAATFATTTSLAQDAPLPQTTTPADTSASMPAPASMQSPDAFTTTGFPEGTQFATAAQSRWAIGRTNLRIVIPDGFVTDFASIPPRLQSLLATQGRYSRAAVIHDYLYWTQTCTRTQSDNLLMIAMTESDVPWLDRQKIYRGVQVGGGSAWASNAAEKAQGLGRFVPAAHRSRINDMSWDALRRYLASLRVRDPASTISQQICALGNSTVVP